MGEPKNQFEIMIDQKAKLVVQLGQQFEQHLYSNAQQQGKNSELSFVFPYHPMNQYYLARLNYYRNPQQQNASQNKIDIIDRQTKYKKSNSRSRSRSDSYPKDKKQKRRQNNSRQHSRSRSYSSSRSSYSKSSNSSYSDRQSKRKVQSSPDKILRKHSSELSHSFSKQVSGSKIDSKQKINLGNQDIGMIISILKNNQKSQNALNKDSSRAFYPYQPLDPNMISQSVVEKIQQKRTTNEVLDQVDEFLDFIDAFNHKNFEERERIAKDKYQGIKTSKGYKPTATSKSESKFLLDFNEEEEAQTQQYKNEDHFKKHLLHEMGINEEGATFGSRYGERRGLGAMGGGDVFEMYRTQRSSRYHVAAEERSKGIREEELCYICQKPGHYAKDCKYGIN